MLFRSEDVKVTIPYELTPQIFGLYGKLLRYVIALSKEGVLWYFGTYDNGGIRYKKQIHAPYPFLERIVFKHRLFNNLVTNKQFDSCFDIYFCTVVVKEEEGKDYM